MSFLSYCLFLYRQELVCEIKCTFSNIFFDAFGKTFATVHKQQLAASHQEDLLLFAVNTFSVISFNIVAVVVNVCTD
jgi:hypothetical protein